PADTLDVPLDEALRAQGGALEEHVLQIVSQAELRGRLIATSRANPELDGDDFTRGVLLNEDADAVVQDVSRGRLGGGWDLDLGRSRGGRKAQPAESEHQRNPRNPAHSGCQAITRDATGRMPHPRSRGRRAHRHSPVMRIPNK